MSSPEMVRILLAILSAMAAILPSSRSLSFNITNFSDHPAFAVCPRNASGDVISLMGDARVQNLGFLQLTTASGSSCGRAYSCARLHLWDRATGAVTNFTTTFSFDIDVQYPATYGEKSGGMTFYLSPVGWPFQSYSNGYSLGLGNLSVFPGVVAVEFDSKGNDSTLDPGFTDGSHIGIDNGNLQSLVTEEIGPLNSFTSGAIGEAVVSYDSAATKLSVSLRFNGSLYGISSVLDLTGVLPEWVSVGFSGSNGGAYDMKRIRSWSFESSLDAAPKQQEKNTTAAADSPAAAAAASDPGNNTDSWKVVAVVFIVIVIVTRIVIVIVFIVIVPCLSGRGKRKKEENPNTASQPGSSPAGTTGPS